MILVDQVALLSVIPPVLPEDVFGTSGSSCLGISLFFLKNPIFSRTSSWITPVLEIEGESTPKGFLELSSKAFAIIFDITFLDSSQNLFELINALV